MIVVPGETEVLIPFRVVDTAGVEITGLAHDAAGLVAEWRHSDMAAWTAIPLMAGVLGTWTVDDVDDPAAWGFADAGHGDYELSLPDAAVPAEVDDRYALVRLRGAASMKPVVLRLDMVGVPRVAPGDSAGGLPTCAVGQGGQTILTQFVNLGAGQVAGIWSYLKSAAAALATTTMGRFVHDQLARIGLTGASVNGAPTANEAEILYAGADHRAATNTRIELRVTGKPDMTDRPLKLGVGLDVHGREAIVTFAGGAVVSGAAGDQTIGFEPSAAETELLEPFIGKVVTAVAQCDFDDGSGGFLHTPVATAEYEVRSKFVVD
jgi:hypothetical protein